MGKIKNKPHLLDGFKEKAQNKAKENKTFLKKLRKKPPPTLDETTEALHHKAFDSVDCLDCANCCKTTSPILIDRDIDRIARRLKIKPSQLIELHLKIDEDNDYVFRNHPCPFLSHDNYCMIYTDRPRACKEYPHTNRKKIHQILNLTWHNTLICPVVFNVVEGLKLQYPEKG